MLRSLYSLEIVKLGEDPVGEDGNTDYFTMLDKQAVITVLSCSGIIAIDNGVITHLPADF